MRTCALACATLGLALGLPAGAGEVAPPPVDLAAYLSRDLRALRLIDAPVTDDDFVQLRAPEFQQLDHVILRGSNLSDRAIQALEGLAITRLTVAQAQLSGAGYETLRTLPLRAITLSHQRVEGSWLQRLHDRKLSEGIFLLSADFGDDDLAMLEGFEHVGLLNLARTRVTGEGLRRLRAFPDLRHLHLQGCAVTPADIAAFRERRPEVAVFGP